uniref:Uncharacterized protein n=1 Tax=Arundo donax TaxID=35708 RepID=A0A0A9CCP0_ARUDO
MTCLSMVEEELVHNTNVIHGVYDATSLQHLLLCSLT